MLFDVVGFGAMIANDDPLQDSVGRVMTINLSSDDPTRKEYVFLTTASATAKKGAIYSHNSYTYIASYDCDSQTSLICMGDGVPLSSGTLQLTSGVGDSLITFSSFSFASVSDSIVAYGFKNLTNGHTYHIGEVSFDNTVIDSVSIDNWQMFYPMGQTPSISLNPTGGPQSTDSIDLVASNNLTVRKPFSNSTMVTSNITATVNKFSDIVHVVDGTLFSVGDSIDLISGSNASMFHAITAINGNELTISPSSPYEFPSFSAEGSQVELTLFGSGIIIDGTTLQINIKDITPNTITLYLQTNKGLTMEWDFTPFSDWIIQNLFWLDETALLPIKIFDNNGVPFPDGTEVQLEVDTREFIATEDTTDSVAASEISSIGTNRLYVTSTDGYTKDMVINLIDQKSHFQTTTISEVGQDSNLNYYIDIYDPLQFDFDPANGARVVINDSSLEDPKLPSLIPINIPVVDVTPIFTNRALDPSKLKDYDITPVPPSTPYSDLNYSRDYIQKGKVETPSIDGYGVIRILPITEDVPRTISEKDLLEANLLKAQPTSPLSSQLEENTGDVESTVFAQNTTSTTITVMPDYTIETPIYLKSGFATSAMTSSSIDLSRTSFEGLTIPGVDDPYLYTKQYSVYASILSKTETGVVKARQYFSPFNVYFANPITIISKKADKTVPYYCPYYDTDNGWFEGYSINNVDGVYAGEGPFEIEYTISNRGILMANGTLNIRIYSNRVANPELTACESGSANGAYLNIKYNTINTIENNQTVVTQPYSDIDTWRNAVAANPFQDIVNSLPPEIPAAPTADLAGNLEVTETPIFYQSPEQWTIASQYAISETTVNIVNGKATYSIPANDTPSILFIEAYVTFNNFESVCADIVFNANPLLVGPVIASFHTPTGLPKDLYEVGVNVSWKNGIEGIIDDGTQLEFYPSKTATSPNVSVTDNGYAGGIRLGPHDIVIDRTNQTLETIIIKITHASGYINSFARLIGWDAKDSEPVKGGKNTFYFGCVTDGNSGWADGSIANNTKITGILKTGKSPMVEWEGDDGRVNSWTGPDGIERLLGFDQPGGARSSVVGDYSIPSIMDWTEDGTVTFTVANVNQNIGFPASILTTSNPPWTNEVTLSTSYIWSDGTTMYGTGATDLDYEYNDEGEIIGVEKVYRPLAIYEEPLNITLDIEDENGAFIRDGIHSPKIVATVTWKGNPLTHEFIVDKGTPQETSVENTFPVVTLKMGKCQTAQGENGYDARNNIIDGCLVITSHPDAKLYSYSDQVSLSRTDIKLDHTHACTVNNNGYGTTTQTIQISAVVVLDHVHTIENYIALASDGHTHLLRSVIITNILPTTNTYDSFVINAYVVYDPTNCLPYTGEGIEYNPLPRDGNRMIFTTFGGDGLEGEEATEPKLILEIETGSDLSSGNPLPSNSGSKTYVGKYYTGETPGETDKGFDFSVHAYFSEYTYEDYPGHFITIPARDVDDGTRITFQIDVFKPAIAAGETSNNDRLIVAPDLIRSYMVIKVTVTVYAEGKFATEEKIVKVVSNIQWMPSVSGLVSEATDDTIYLNNVTSNITTLGASQIYDAITMAAQRIITYQTDTASLKDYKKFIILLTDGDENQSQYSIQQSIDTVSFINGDKETQILPIKMGLTYKDDEVVIKKIANDTGGFPVYCVDMLTSEIDSSINSIFSNSSFDFNNGTYSNNVTFDDAYIVKDISLSNMLIPYNTSILYRARFSENGNNWDAWTSWTSSSNALLIPENQSKYVQYGVKLFGNEYFQTPSLTEDVAVDYYRNGKTSVFFAPLNVDIGNTDSGGTSGGSGSGGTGSNGSGTGGMGNDEYLASIHITHEADIPSTSKVLYGVTPSISTEPLDYFEITADNHTIMLTRFNELLITENNRTFTAINGRWPVELEIEVYRINSENPNGTPVDSSDYMPNSRLGTITFFNSQNATDEFVICVYFNPVFRLICKITNYGAETAQIHHVGIIYNIAKRIPTDSEGSIIHIPIRDRA